MRLAGPPRPPRRPSLQGIPIVSAVVVNFNQREHLYRCLASLRGALDRVENETETLVVDNGSMDGSNEMVRRCFPAVNLLELGKNTGFAFAVTQGIGQTTGEWVLLLNNDATLEAETVATLLAAARTRVDVGSVAAKILFADGSNRINSAGFAVDRLGIAYDRLLGLPCQASEPSPIEVFGASGGGALFRRAMLEDVGGIDETFFMYLEDVDLAWRARARGWRCLYVPDAVVHHHHSVSSGHGSDLKYFHVGRNRVRLLAKNASTAHLMRYGAAMIGYDVAYMLIVGVTDRTRAPLQGRVRGLREWRTYRTGSAQHDSSMLEPVSGFRAALARRSAWLASSAGASRKR